MEEMEAVKNGGFPATLDPYVQQGRMFLFNAAQNLIQYGRVLTEAKPLVPRGQFENWVRTNFNMSERSAQGYMAVWRRFGTNAVLQDVQFSNLQKMLALPEGTETQFAEENDLKAMTAREVEKAVRQVREEEQNRMNLALADAREEATQAINREKGARMKAELRMQEAEARTAAAEQRSREPDEELAAAVAAKDAEIKKLRYAADIANHELSLANNQLADAREELRELEEALAENQQEYDRMQADLLNAQSTIARGDAERVISDQFTIEDFSAAVRGFLGSAAQMPYMAEAFRNMTDQREIRQWDSLLQAVEDWAVKSRRSMNQGGIIDG